MPCPIYWRIWTSERSGRGHSRIHWQGISGNRWRGEARRPGERSEEAPTSHAQPPFAVPLSNAERASLDCGNAEKRNALVSGGVDVFRLSKEKIVSEAVALLNELYGQKLSSQNKPSSVKTDWANLTKTGKTPKKVAECHVIFDWKSGDSTICHIWYGRDLEPYAADVYY